MASVVVVPWAVNGNLHWTGTDAVAEDTVLVQQPSPESAAAETVREINQDEPFSMVALTGTGPHRHLRADPGKARRLLGHLVPPRGIRRYHRRDEQVSRGTDPVHVGSTTAVQIAVKRPYDAPVTVAPPDSGGCRPGPGLRTGKCRAVVVPERSAILITPLKSPVERQVDTAQRHAGPGQPPTSSAAPNGAPEAEMRCGGPYYGNGIRARGAASHRYRK